MPDLHHHSTSSEPIQDIHTDETMAASGLMPKKAALHKKFIQTLEHVLPHLGHDETKIVSALIILALKLDGIIGKDISEKESKLIEILKEMVVNDSDKKASALAIANRVIASSNNNTLS
ncbi:MAG: hypothetical protein ISQ13_05230 [Candidatus Margulisbacteria bacterium]|nr:hypothetical protein [Candidatus Margulisiibacteriota bacterium]